MGSRRTGKSGWCVVRTARLLRLSGLSAGGMVHIYFLFPEGEESIPIEVSENCEVPVAEGALAVRAEHVAGEECNVFIDLVR